MHTLATDHEVLASSKALKVLLHSPLRSWRGLLSNDSQPKESVHIVEIFYRRSGELEMDTKRHLHTLASQALLRLFWKT